MKKRILSTISVMAFVSAALQAAPMANVEVNAVKQELLTPALTITTTDIHAGLVEAIQVQVNDALKAKIQLIAQTKDESPRQASVSIGE